MNKPNLILSILLTAALITGCTDHTKLKKDVQASLSKQIEMKNYVFSGSADIDLGNVIPQAKDSNAITANLLGILQTSKLKWTGVASTDPVQLEVDLSATPALLGTALELPMILKDNKLYMNIPLLSQKDEYFSIDLATAGSENGQKNPLSPESLKNVTQMTSQIANLFITDMKDAWFKQSSAPVSLKDGMKGSLITIDVTDKNKVELSAVLQAKIPQIIDMVATNGIITPVQAANLKQNNMQSLQIATPSSISLTLDELGFIREQNIQIQFSMKDAAGAVTNHHLNLDQAYDQINQNPKFTKEIPTKIKPFADVLKLLQPQK